MKRIITSIASYLLLLSAVGAAERTVKPTREIVRAKDGLKIVCESRGQGDTALIFLHGWCGDRQYWRNQADLFAADYRVVTLDQAGHSESGKDRKVWTASGLAEDVEAVAKALDLKRLILVGHSMGGPIALMAAKRMPDRVIGVVGVDTLQNAEFKRPEEVTKTFLDAFSADFDKTLREMFPGMLPEKTDPELTHWLLEKAAAQDHTMALALIRDVIALDMTELFKNAHKPIRCINSGGPFPFHTPTAIEINRKYADYDAMIIEKVGHYPMLEKPAEFNDKLRATLKELAPKNRPPQKDRKG